MKILNSNTKREIKEHSLDEAPNECCGLILEVSGETKVLRCNNVANDKKTDFEIDVLDYLKGCKEGNIKAYYHSHPHDEIGKFSDADIKVSDAHGLPVIMYSIFHDNFFELNNE